MSDAYGALLMRKFVDLDAIWNDCYRRFRMPSRFSREDARAEFLVLLHELLSTTQLDPDGEEFSALISRAARNRIISLCRRHLTPKRNVKREVNWDGDSDSHGHPLGPTLKVWNHESDLELQERVQLIENRLPPEARELWSLLVCNDHEASLQEYNRQRLDQNTTGKPRRCRRDPTCREFLRWRLQWDARKFHRNLRLIQAHVEIVFR